MLSFSLALSHTLSPHIELSHTHLTEPSLRYLSLTHTHKHLSCNLSLRSLSQTLLSHTHTSFKHVPLSRTSLATPHRALSHTHSCHTHTSLTQIALSHTPLVQPQRSLLHIHLSHTCTHLSHTIPHTPLLQHIALTPSQTHTSQSSFTHTSCMQPHRGLSCIHIHLLHTHACYTISHTPLAPSHRGLSCTHIHTYKDCSLKNFLIPLNESLQYNTM